MSKEKICCTILIVVLMLTVTGCQSVLDDEKYQGERFGVILSLESHAKVENKIAGKKTTASFTNRELDYIYDEVVEHLEKRLEIEYLILDGEVARTENDHNLLKEKYDLDYLLVLELEDFVYSFNLKQVKDKKTGKMQAELDRVDYYCDSEVEYEITDLNQYQLDGEGEADGAFQVRSLRNRSYRKGMSLAKLKSATKFENLYDKKKAASRSLINALNRTGLY